MIHQISPPQPGIEGALGASDDARARTATVSEGNMARVTYYQTLELATVGRATSGLSADCYYLCFTRSSAAKSTTANNPLATAEIRVCPQYQGSVPATSPRSMIM